MAAALRAVFFYLFLVFVVRIVGRRPGKQITPFEFVLVFFMGGLALTAMVGDEASLTNALIQILTIGLCHYAVAQARFHSRSFARLMDGTPLILLEDGSWRAETMKRSGIEDDDVMSAARSQGIVALDGIALAVLERNGEINVIEREDEE